VELRQEQDVEKQCFSVCELPCDYFLHVSRTYPGYGDASVLEVVSDYSGDTFRAVYTVRWPERIYVLHVFQKKSKSGAKTPKSDMNLIDARLKRLTELHAQQAKLSKGGKK
jgi:phage-related protein